MDMCVNVYNEPERKGIKFKPLDDCEKTIFNDNLDKISKAIDKGERILNQLFKKPKK